MLTHPPATHAGLLEAAAARLERLLDSALVAPAARCAGGAAGDGAMSRGGMVAVALAVAAAETAGNADEDPELSSRARQMAARALAAAAVRRALAGRWSREEGVGLARLIGRLREAAAGLELGVGAGEGGAEAALRALGHACAALQVDAEEAAGLAASGGRLAAALARRRVDCATARPTPGGGWLSIGRAST